MKYKWIKLTKGQKAKVSLCDYELLCKYKWCADPIDRGGYRAVTTINGKSVRMHRFIMGLEAGDSRIVDHLDHDPLNNTRENLRITTTANNNRRSQQRDSMSGYKGVRLISDKKGTWRATIQANNKFIHLGTFTCKHKAALAYNEAALMLYGKENCVLNKVPERFKYV